MKITLLNCKFNAWTFFFQFSEIYMVKLDVAKISEFKVKIT